MDLTLTLGHASMQLRSPLADRGRLRWPGSEPSHQDFRHHLHFFLLRPELGQLPACPADPGGSDSPASSSHSHNIRGLPVASCTPDLEITTNRPGGGDGVPGWFPPHTDSTHGLHSGCSAVIVHVLWLICNKCELTYSSFAEFKDPQVPSPLPLDHSEAGLSHW